MAKKNFIFFIIFLIVFGFLIFEKIEAGTSDNISGYAWSENIGWISFNSVNCDSDGDGLTDTGNYSQCPVGATTTNYGVNIKTDGVFEGYAWSENIGWISFNRRDTATPPGPPYNGAETYIAKLDLRTGQVTGWARALAYGDGWDGWIKLRGTAQNGDSYGVNIATTTGEFHGYAWSDMVIGWISFNCSNQGVCGTSTYKVITSFSFNQPPEKPSTSETWDHCSVQKLSVPIFSWTYSDPDNDPQAAYQIKIYGETTLDETVTCNVSPCLSYAPTSEWVRNNLNWAETYSWQVRVKDDQGNWSEWSDSNSFTMPAHACPWPEFIPSPASPFANEVVEFIQDGSDGAEALCYQDGEHLCQGDPNVNYAWDFSYQSGDGFQEESSYKGNATTTYRSSGSYTVRLRITDNTLPAPNNYCYKDRTVTISLPLPEWKEIAPF